MNKQFDVKGFSYGFQDTLTDNKLIADVRSFWKDSKEHISIQFEPQENQRLKSLEIEIEGLLEMENIPVKYEVFSFYANEKNVVMITFENQNNEEN